MNILEEINKIKKYVDDTYEISTELITDDDVFHLNINFNGFKYDFFIEEPDEMSFAPNNYLLMCGKDSIKRGSNYYGTDWADIYRDINDFINDDLVKELPKKNFNQISMF